MGEFNDVTCAGIEHKMGIHGNPTCTMVFGDEGKCQGFLMGQERQGMKIMFQMMNEARLYVGGQGASVSSAAYMHAVTYARNRVQGKRVEDMMKPDAKSTTIMNHPDVKRMLLSMKARVEAMRTLTLYLRLPDGPGPRGEGRGEERSTGAARLPYPHQQGRQHRLWRGK